MPTRSVLKQNMDLGELLEWDPEEVGPNFDINIFFYSQEIKVFILLELNLLNWCLSYMNF